MKRSFGVCAAVALVAHLLTASAASAENLRNPLRFFEGRTEGDSTVKVIMKKPFHTHNRGIGQVKRDGSLYLLQHVDEEGRPPHDRSWQIRQVAPGRYVGTMSEASGPVIVEQVGSGFRFRFKMKGGLSVEQWLTPLAGGRSARNNFIIRKMGMTVARAEGLIRKLN